jgi:hypothetical protein
LLRDLQPLRYRPLVWLVAAVVAGWGEPVEGRSRSGLVAIVGLAAALMAWGLVDGFSCRFENRLVPSQNAFIAWVRRIEPLPGRLMVECGERREPQFSDLIPLDTGQPVLGGSNPGNFLLTRHTLFAGSYPVLENGRVVFQADSPWIFGGHLDAFSEESLAENLRRYNVSAIAAWSPASIRLLSAFPRLLTPAGHAPPFSMFRVNSGTSSWTVEGHATVTADLDRITVDRPTQGRVILAFHWIPTLRADPAVAMSPAMVGNDPAPFIALEVPPGTPRVTIDNRGGSLRVLLTGR